MTPLELYESFIIKANENAQTDNVAVDKGRFAVIYNESAIKFVEWILEKRNEDEIRYLHPILDTVSLTFKAENTEPVFVADVPSDFFDIGNVNAKASDKDGCCSKVDLDLYEIKTENKNSILTDEFSSPSIEYREAPFYLEDYQVRILVDNFIIDSGTLTYYKYPKQIELIDPDDPESAFKNQNDQMDFDDKALGRIISIAVADYSLNVSNPKLQADKQRVVSKF